MALQPEGSVKSKIDMTRSHFEYLREYPLVTGTTITDEGLLMIRGGTTTVQATTSAGAGGEIPLGIALYGSIQVTTFTHYEAFTVPATLTYTLDKTNLIDVGGGVAECYAYNVTGGAILTVIAPGAPAAAQIAITTATGVCTFNAAQSGASVWVRYRYTPTATEIQDRFRSSPINRGSEDIFSKIVVGVGHCVVYTSNYDGRGAWQIGLQSGAANSPCCGAGGRITTIALSGASTPFGRVVDLPTANSPYLGIEYDISMGSAA